METRMEMGNDHQVTFHCEKKHGCISIASEWILCVGIEIDISQRKTETLHLRAQEMKNSSEDSDSDIVLLSVEQPP